MNWGKKKKRENLRIWHAPRLLLLLLLLLPLLLLLLLLLGMKKRRISGRWRCRRRSKVIHRRSRGISRSTLIKGSSARHQDIGRTFIAAGRNSSARSTVRRVVGQLRSRGGYGDPGVGHGWHGSGHFFLLDSQGTGADGTAGIDGWIRRMWRRWSVRPWIAEVRSGVRMMWG